MLVKSGIAAVITGLVVGLFTGISKFMEAQNVWVGLTIERIIGETRSESIILYFNSEGIQSVLQYLVVDLPFSFFLMGLGGILLVLSLFFRSH